MNNTNLSSLIWSSADDELRGVFKPNEYGRIILPFVVFRRLDCVLEPVKDDIYEIYEQYKDTLSNPSPVIKSKVDKPFFNRSKFDLERLKSDPDNIAINFNNYIYGYSRNVLDIIENFSINPLVEKLHKNKRLYSLISKFTEFNLHPSVIDNHQMGSVYEELLRRFSEMSKEESGDHYTPRDVVKLLVALVFGGAGENLQGEGKIRSIYDPCCGTGGMLTVGKDWILENVNPSLEINLYGQELNDVTYSICKSDILMLGEDPETIHGPHSSLSDDRLSNRKFDYMISNPPYGVSWKSEKDFIMAEKNDPNGRFLAGTPRISDGSLLFLQHMIHKMSPNGTRIGIVFNGSPLFTGDAGSGESNIRKWVIENDWLEAIVRLPNQLFFNTGITTYFWIVTNRKTPHRRGKVQLIDAAGFARSMKKSLGGKRKKISEAHVKEIRQIYENFSENEHCKIFPNNYFGYTKVTVDQPQYDEDGKIVSNKSGKPQADTKKRDYERVPLSQSVDEYFESEVKPHLPDAWMDRTKDKIGYAINFNKYFYRSTPLRSLEEISRDLKVLDAQINQLSVELAIE